MKNLLYVLIPLWLISCQYGKPKYEGKPIDSTELHIVGQEQTPDNSQGYKLMKQYCFACHIEKPDPQKRKAMTAPPMVRVQEHYKPAYANKVDFVNAVVKWVNKPNEKDVKMPGAVRKFGLMPPLPIGDDKLKAIAGYLYDAKFDAIRHGKQMHGKQIQEKASGLKLNNGKKWQLEKNDHRKIQKILNRLQSFKSDKIVDYQQLGKEIFDNAKPLMLNKNYKDQQLQQIHNFFHTVEEDMHRLMSVKDIAEGQKYVVVLQSKFKDFFSFFE